MTQTDLMRVLIDRNNDFFRQTHDASDEMYLFDTQINAGRKVVMRLASNILRTNHVVLVAKMQSGKTGVCNAIVNIINKTKLDREMCVNKYFFICGMNDVGLKNQTYERVVGQIEDATTENTVHGRMPISTHTKYHVLKNSDLPHFNGFLDNSVIFIDESHYGTNEKNVLTQFLLKHGVDWKNKNDLISRNIYIVSVSATPFDEAVSDTVHCKDLIELDTTDTYVGVSEYLNNDLIFDATKEDISEGGAIFDFIMNAHDRMQENGEDGVIFIRTRKFDVIKDNNYVQKNFNVFEMFSSGSKIEYRKLDGHFERIIANNALFKRYRGKKRARGAKPLIVLIKGAFRAGITIKAQYKDLIYMVYDFSVKADTTAQALLGRMCGYRSSLDHIGKNYFYINKKFANMYSLWENNFQDGQLIPCNNMKMEWMDNGYSGTDVEFGSKPCGNFTISLTDDEVREIYLKCKGRRNKVMHLGDYFKEFLVSHNINVPYDYIHEIQTSGKNHYAESSQKKRFESFSEDSLVFQFRPEKMKAFQKDTNRDYLTRDDVGKKCVSFVLDAEITEDRRKRVEVSGNKRLLVYYVEVGQKAKVYSRKGQYKPHKDTNIELAIVA